MNPMRTTRRGEPLRTRRRRAVQALADGARLAFALVGVNLGKTWSRLRGRRGACQNPSDSGRGGETGCDAVALWHDPARFRCACPLLQHYPGRGWRCSVDRGRVRTFWGRAVAAYGLSALLLGLAAAAGLRVLWRDQGVRFVDLAWPAHWSRIRPLRSAAFVAQARAALERRDLGAATVCFRSALAVDPRDATAARGLAQLLQIPQPAEADAIYRDLLARDPAEAELTARSWLQSLLARGRFDELQKLAAARLSAADASAPGAWLRAWLLADSYTGDAAALDRLLAAPHLPDEARATLGLARELRGMDAAAGRSRLLLAAADPATRPIELYYVCQWLTRHGHGYDTLAVLQARRVLVTDRDFVALRFDALAAVGETAPLRAEAGQLLAQDPSAAVIDVLCAHLLRHPDAAIRGLVVAAVAGRHPPFVSAETASLVGLFCVCARDGDPDGMKLAGDRIAQTTGVPFSVAPVVAPYLAGQRPGAVPGDWMPLLQPLSADVMHALIETSVPLPAGPIVPPRTRPARS